MNTEQREKRLMEAFVQLEAGVSLATLQRLYADVASELNQIAEAQQALKQGRVSMRPDPVLGRRIVAALAQQQRLRESSLFMSKLWRFAAPVGVAALALMFVLAGQHATPIEPVVSEQADIFATEAAPMMAKNAAVSLMAVEAPQPESFAARSMGDDAVEAPVAHESIDRLYLWQMIALGLLVILSLVLLSKHIAARRARI